MDKNKILDAATKLVAKGAYDKAIKEYQKLLDADPKDVRILHKLGELYEKKNDNVQAAAFFTRVADSYAVDGFSMKAIALYKKILKLDPNLIEVNVKLAELHQQHQLMSEAMAYYQAVANHYDSRGDMKASLDILKRMVELEPDNVASRIKLADLYAREGLGDQASEEYRRASEHLRRTGRIDDYLRVAERLFALRQDDVELARDLAQEYLGRSDQKRALAKLQVCFKADPRDVQTLTLLAQAFLGLGQTSKTLSVYKELARIHTEAGRADDASRVWAKVAQVDPMDPDLRARNAAGNRSAAAASAAGPVQGSAPANASGGPGQASPQGPSQSQSQSQVQGSAPSAGPAASSAAPRSAQAGAGGLSREQLSKLLTETDVYVKYGLHDKALEHLRRVFAVDPENLDAHEKAYQIYVAANNGPAAAEQMLNVLRLCTRREEVARAQPYLVQMLQTNPHHPEVPAFLAVLRTADTALPPQPSAQEEEGIPEDAILVESSDEEIFVADEPQDALADDDLALAHAHAQVTSHAAVEGEDVIHEPALGDDEPLVSGLAGDDEPLVYDAASAQGDEEVVDEPVLEAMPLDAPDADGAGARTPWLTAADPQANALGDPELHEAPTRAHAMSPELVALARQAEAAAAARGAAPAGEAGDVVYELGDDDPALLSTAAYQALTQAQLVSQSSGPQNPWNDAPVEAQLADESAEDPWERTSRIDSAEAEAIISGQTAVPEAPQGGAYAYEGQVIEASPDGAVAGSEWGLAEQPVEAPPEEEPAAEECDEAAFFLDQGLLEEARDIIETVLIAFPGHARALELQARLERAEAGGDGASEGGGDDGGGAWGDGGGYADGYDGSAQGPGGYDAGTAGAGGEAFDLAAELEGELGSYEAEAQAPSAAADDYQVSVEEVFSEFKRGLEKIVKPEDVETHYDLGIAYKEMGLLDDAIGEFEVARQGCVGKKKEVDCLTMIGLLQMMKGDPVGAVEAFKTALNAGGQVTPETARSLRLELATAWESAGHPGRALYHLQRVAAEAPDFRGVSQNVQRLAQLTQPEPDDEEGESGMAGGGLTRAEDPGNAAAAGARSGKVGYI